MKKYETKEGLSVVDLKDSTKNNINNVSIVLLIARTW
jgi:hypothetical protein